jgi:luciferase family oxidoreductase group 1
VIAEQFGTLESLYPGRIDLGLGRAPGTDQRTLLALRRDPTRADDFPREVQELQAFLAAVQPGQSVQAVPGGGLEVPIWILGSSTFGAQLAAQLGLPYAFASHFAPAQLEPALQIYRARFQPSAQLAKPYVMLGVNVVAAETNEEARLLRTSLLQAFVNLRRGRPGELPPPDASFEATMTPNEHALVEQMLTCSVYGDAETVQRGLRAFQQRTRADELMLTAHVFDHRARLKSYEIAAAGQAAFGDR